MIECQDCERLEKEFIAVRTKRSWILLGGKTTNEIIGQLEELDRQELKALFALMDHRAEHK
jgi:hypothetical protein